MENWKDIPGYGGQYVISDKGRIYSTKRDRILRPHLKKKGYAAVVLHNKDGGKTRVVSHLVAECFLGTRPKGLIVLHGSNGPSDDSVNNLSYGSYYQNQIDRRRDNTSRSKRVRRSDGKEFDRVSDAAYETGCNPGNLASVCRGERNLCGGFSWEYIQ